MFWLILALARADIEENSYPFADVPAMENSMKHHAYIDFEEPEHHAYIDFEADESVDLDDNSYPFADAPAQEVEKESNAWCWNPKDGWYICRSDGR